MTPARRPRRGATVAALAAAALLLACPPGASAHARLVRSSPAAGVNATAPPAQVELWFSELLDDGFNTVEVVRADARAGRPAPSLALGAPAVDRGDRTHLVVAVSRLPPGEYAVEWRVLSRDGHSAAGRFTFRVRAAE